jgi:uncharacterized membrane protein YccF (DUF307 family)
MRHNKDVFRALKLHNDQLETNYNVSVTFTATIAVIIFIIILGLKGFWISLFDLSIGYAVTSTRVEFV